MSNEIDNIIVNLKILSELEQNKKIITKENLLNVERSNLIPESLKRYWRGDSRDETVKKLDLIITKAIDLKESNQQIVNLLESSKKGLLNLKETYSDCPQTKARLDAILLKIYDSDTN